MQNHNSKSRITQGLCVLLSFAFLIFSFSGCATTGPQMSLPTYNINGIPYTPLVALCEQRGIQWKYDTFTKSVSLSKEQHKINFRVGDTIALFDGKKEYLHHPADIYQGELVVSNKFKERILEALFKVPSRRAVFPAGVIKKVVIDAGHGGKDPGAIGKTGLREKDVNLDIAKRLAVLLKNEGIKVVMTRSSDVFIPLERRVRIANDADVDLFISIHSNSNRVRSLKGFEIYCISPQVSDLNRAWKSAQSTKLNLDNAHFHDNTTALRATLWDMIYTVNRAESIELARDICKSIDDNLSIRVIGVKKAAFHVLKGVYMPAVLIEIGFLSNSEEERLLKNGYYRQQIAEAIVGGISDYAVDYASNAEAN